MNSKLSFVLAICGMAVVVGGFSYLMNRDDDFDMAAVSLPRATVSDPAFGGDAVETLQRPAPDVVYQQTSFRADGVTPKVVKTLFANDVGSFLHPRGHFVRYAYYRQDGTLEKTKLVHPEPSLSSSVITAYSWTHYAADGRTVVLAEYFRADGTLGAVSDDVKNVYSQMRLNGKTVRYLQTYDGRDYHATYFRPDGKTPWWTFDYGTDSGRVHFDRHGNPVERTFSRTSLTKGFSMGSGDPPIRHYQDNYHRADGTLEYRQTWYHMWDAQNKEFCDALGAVEVFAADGKTVVRVIEFDLRNHRSPLVVKSDTKPAEPQDSIWLQGFGVSDLYGYDNDFVDK